MAEVRRSTEVGVDLRSKGHTAHWGPLYIPPGRCVGVVTAGALVFGPLLNATPPPHTQQSHTTWHTQKGLTTPLGLHRLVPGPWHSHRRCRPRPVQPPCRPGIGTPRVGLMMC